MVESYAADPTVRLWALLLVFPPKMTCWWGWYTVYWAEASPRLNKRKGKTIRIFMAGENARRNLETSGAQRWNLKKGVRGKKKKELQLKFHYRSKAREINLIRGTTCNQRMPVEVHANNYYITPLESS
jgi:hypothetical protein